MFIRATCMNEEKTRHVPACGNRRQQNWVLDAHPCHFIRPLSYLFVRLNQQHVSDWPISFQAACLAPSPRHLLHYYPLFVCYMRLGESNACKKKIFWLKWNETNLPRLVDFLLNLLNFGCIFFQDTGLYSV